MKRDKEKEHPKRFGGCGSFLLAFMLLALVLLAITGVTRALEAAKDKTASASVESSELQAKLDADRPKLDVQLLTYNEYSRPGDALEQVNGIVIHYTANRGSSAQANRDYFEGLKDTGETSASAHFIVGLNGEVVQCIPTAEIAYASNDRNSDTVSIECCYENEDGSFNRDTYSELVHLTAWLCAKFSLTSESVIRHYDVTGKLCPIYYVEHEEEWDAFRADVETYLNAHYDQD